TTYDSHFFSHASATREIYTLSLHDAPPISIKNLGDKIVEGDDSREICLYGKVTDVTGKPIANAKMDIWQACSRGTYDMQEKGERSEEHTSELQSRENLVCRLLLEKKKSKIE